MIPAPFEYHRPKSVDETLGLLAQYGDDARIVAGGHSLIPMMKLRMAQPEHLVDLRHVTDLDFIREDAGTLVIGAMVTQAALIASALVRDKCPIIPEASAQIADPQVRNCGTIGGNLANGDPGNDLPAVMLALDATYDIVSKSGTRQVAARAFYKGALETALEDGELLSAVRIPIPVAGCGHAYTKQKRKIGDYATAAAAVLVTMSGGKCTDAAVALTNVGNTPLLADAAAKALIGTSVDAAAINTAATAAMAITAPASDTRGPAEFRTQVAGVMVRRAIGAARGRAA
jgi:aerobic carbon-monoxide dehydrogenase medium subunit